MQDYLENHTVVLNGSGSTNFTAQYFSDIAFRTTLIPSFIYILVLFIIGVPGNFLVCYVYYYKWPRNKTRIFIISLAIFDFINNITALPTELALLWNYLVFDYPEICKATRFITFCMNSASATVLVGIALDRLYGICFWSRVHIITTKVAKRISLGAVLLAIAMSWPALYIFGTFTQTNTFGVVLKTCLIDDRYVYTIYPNMLKLYVLVSNLVYDLTLIVLYSIVGSKIYRNRDFGKINSQMINRTFSTPHINDACANRRHSKLLKFCYAVKDKNRPKYLSKWKKSIVKPKSTKTHAKQMLERYESVNDKHFIKKLLENNAEVGNKKPVETYELRTLKENKKIGQNENPDPKGIKRLKFRSLFIKRPDDKTSKVHLTRRKFKSSYESRNIGRNCAASRETNFTQENICKSTGNEAKSSAKQISRRDVNPHNNYPKAVNASKQEMDTTQRQERSSSCNGRINSIKATTEYRTSCVRRTFRTTKSITILFIVTVVFVVSFLPYCVIALVRHNRESEKESPLAITLRQLFLRTYFLSSVLNPIIYSGLSVRFRNECKTCLKNMICFFFCKKKC